MSKAKFVEVSFRCYDDAGGFGPKQHFFEVTFFIKSDTKIRLRRHEGYKKDSKSSDRYNGAAVIVDGAQYSTIDNYDTVYAKITAALNQVL